MKTLRNSFFRKSISMTLMACIIFLNSCMDGGNINGQTMLLADNTTAQPAGLTPPSGKKIQLALLLDTSNSMDGLIDQAKSTLWKFVNALSATTYEGVKPELDIALYEYGNDGLNEEKGYVRQVSAFTGELDVISEKLFSLSTNGGSEYCGTVIKSSIDELQWVQGSDDLKIIFIAGNEPFDQGRVRYQSSCELAQGKNIIINTIYCGEFNEGKNTHWQTGATCSKGSYMSIDHNSKTVYIETPYDDKIDSLNTILNNTYIYYGSDGFAKYENQRTQDSNSEYYGKENKVERAVSKSSSFYKNDSWDLVDASESKSFDINKIKNSELPKDMQAMTEEQKIEYIKIRKEERILVRKQINDINVLRNSYIANNSITPEAQSLDAAMLQAIKDQAIQKGYQIQ